MSDPREITQLFSTLFFTYLYCFFTLHKSIKISHNESHNHIFSQLDTIINIKNSCFHQLAYYLQVH